jgi:Tol biopolymer transport system component
VSLPSVGVPSVSRAATSPRRFEADDLYGLTSPGEPQFGPDGTTLLYLVAGLDRQSDTYRANLRVRSLGSGEDREVVTGRGRLRRPQFSPLGTHIAFIDVTDGGLPQIWLVGLEGNDRAPHELTSAGEVSDFA